MFGIVFIILGTAVAIASRHTCHTCHSWGVGAVAVAPHRACHGYQSRGANYGRRAPSLLSEFSRLRGRSRPSRAILYLIVVIVVKPALSVAPLHRGESSRNGMRLPEPATATNKPSNYDNCDNDNKTWRPAATHPNLTSRQTRTTTT